MQYKWENTVLEEKEEAQRGKGAREILKYLWGRERRKKEQKEEEGPKEEEKERFKGQESKEEAGKKERRGRSNEERPWPKDKRLKWTYISSDCKCDQSDEVSNCSRRVTEERTLLPIN